MYNKFLLDAGIYDYPLFNAEFYCKIDSRLCSNHNFQRLGQLYSKVSWNVLLCFVVWYSKSLFRVQNKGSGCETFSYFQNVTCLWDYNLKLCEKNIK